MTKRSIGDVSPQFMTVHVVESAANTFTQEEFETPVTPEAQGGAIVMEILKVFVNHDVPPPDVTSACAKAFLRMSLTRDSKSSMPAAYSTDLVCPQYRYIQSIREVGTTANNHSDVLNIQPKVIDVTDGDGNGIIYAKKNIFISAQGSDLTGAVDTTMKILYRLVKVSIQEYLGLVLE